ncbi:hypothetical protein [Oricola sp.]|uniref:hypothetical protein n=1 Tax=Oricola sp. TaxID=1979950 RepID=UPI003BAA00F1
MFDGQSLPERTTACIEYQTLGRSRRFFGITPLIREEALSGEAGWIYHEPDGQLNSRTMPNPG